MLNSTFTSTLKRCWKANVLPFLNNAVFRREAKFNTVILNLQHSLCKFVMFMSSSSSFETYRVQGSGLMQTTTVFYTKCRHSALIKIGQLRHLVVNIDLSGENKVWWLKRGTSVVMVTVTDCSLYYINRQNHINDGKIFLHSCKINTIMKTEGELYSMKFVFIL